MFTGINRELLEDKAILYLQGGGEPLCFNHDMLGDPLDGNNPMINVVSGGVSLLGLRVFFGRYEAKILECDWELNGKLVDLGRAVQGPEESHVPILEGPLQMPGGALGNPALLMAAWVGQGGTFPFTVSGVLLFQGKKQKFELTGAIHVRTPDYNFEAMGGVHRKPAKFLSHPKLQGDVSTYEDPERDLQYIGISRSDEGFTWRIEKNDDMPAEEGFIQLKYFVTTRLDQHGNTQYKGLLPMDDLVLLDVQSPGSFWKRMPASGRGSHSEIAYGPIEILQRQDPDFPDKLFDAYQRLDNFLTHAAFRPLPQTGIIDGFALSLGQVRWFWAGHAEWSQELNAYVELYGDQELSAPESGDYMPIEWDCGVRERRFQRWEEPAYAR